MASAHDGSATATCATDRLWDGLAHVPAALRDTVPRAWSASLPHHEWNLRATLVTPGAPDGVRTVLFDRSGPGN